MSFEGTHKHCTDCGTEIGNGVRCGDCTVDCRACGATFKTEADRNNHEYDGHCAACGTLLGDRPAASPRRVAHREEIVHEQDHFVTEEEEYQHPVTENIMGGGFLCDECGQGDLTLL